MQDTKRCCGSGACIIDAHGHCWCGQQWDGNKMCSPPTHIESATARGIEPSTRPMPCGMSAVSGAATVKRDPP